jgi:hypothetical protein
MQRQELSQLRDLPEGSLRNMNNSDEFASVIAQCVCVCVCVRVCVQIYELYLCMLDAFSVDRGKGPSARFDICFCFRAHTRSQSLA